MNDPNRFGYHEAPGPGLAPPGEYPPRTAIQPPKFSPEELKVLGECNRESFFQRCLPLGTALGFTTYVAVQKGHLKPNPRFGAFPKMSLAVVMGYFLGKMSYQQACAEKLMALPGSYIGQVLRDRKEGKITGTFNPAQPVTPMLGATPGDIYSDAGPGNSLDLDTDRPTFNEDTYRPDSDGLNPNLHDQLPSRPSMSYEEMRRQNRGQYADARQNPYRIDPNTAPPPISRPAPVQPSPATSTNKYGDVME